MAKHRDILSTALLSLAFASCRGDDDDGNHTADIPLVSRDSGNDALGEGSANLTAGPLAELSLRFLHEEGGPGNIPGFLDELNQIISEINAGSFAAEKACELSSATPYLLHPPGGDIEMFGQCYQNIELGPTVLKADFNQYGSKDGSSYIYAVKHEDQIAAILTPTASRQYSLKAIYSIGGDNSPSWSSEPYGLASLQLDTMSGAFEFSASGLGLGYCSVQMKSDGEDIFASYSLETGEACGDRIEICASLSGSVLETCPDALRVFDLPLLTRESGVATVTFDGSLHDSTIFGPVLPSPELGGL